MNLNHSHRVPWHYVPRLAAAGIGVMLDLMSPRRIANRFAKELRYPLPPCRGVSHHLSHSACAYFASPFDHAAVLTVDGQGEDESGSS